MRVFISVYPGFTLAIPMDAVASMVLYKQKTEKTVQYDPESRSTYVSLPWLFNMPDQTVPHGVILREWNSKENKVVLLTAEVKRDIEIPDEEFYPIPKSLDATRFSAIFNGIKFSDNPVLLLNIEKLLQVIQNEQWVTDKKTNPPEPQPSPQPSIAEPPIAEPPIVEPPIVEPPKSPTVVSEPSSLTFEPQPSPQDEVSPLAEVLEICEIPDDFIEVCEIIEISEVIEVVEAIEVCEVLEAGEAIKVCKVLEPCEAIDEVLEICETID